MGVRQSSPMAESRTRAYSSPVPSSGGSTTPVFRYTAGPGGPQIHYTGWNRPSSYHQVCMSVMELVWDNSYMMSNCLTHGDLF